MNTVKLCKRGHERTPENVNKRNDCKICQAMRAEIWRKDHADVLRERRSVVRLGDLMSAREKDRIKRTQNPEAARLRSAAWHAAHPNETQAGNRKWRAENPERARSNKNAWNNANKDKLAAYSKKSAEDITMCYVAARLRLPVSKLTPELFEIKRDKILMSRELKQLHLSIKGE